MGVEGTIKGRIHLIYIIYRETLPQPLCKRGGVDTTGKETERLISPYREQRGEYSIRSARQYYMQRCDNTENQNSIL